VQPIGKVVSEQLIHRLPEFCALSGAKEGEILTADQLAKLIAADKGLFAKAKGKKILFINQVEDQAERDKGGELAALLPKQFLAELYGFIWGSVKQGEIAGQHRVSH
jgi:probable selenium-dependent hydroxylase accessory protein YqeC